MSKKQYEKFSLGLALFDALPVIFFSTAMILIAMHFRVAAFIAGAICCTAAGLGKVCWKIIIAATGKDIWPLNKQLRILMPAGFALMIAGLVIGMDRKLWQTLGVCVVSFPAVLLFSVRLMAGHIKETFILLFTMAGACLIVFLVPGLFVLFPGILCGIASHLIELGLKKALAID